MMYNESVEVWQFDKLRIITITNAGLPPTHADAWWGEYHSWDEAREVGRRKANELGYTLKEHNIYESDGE
jgi:hypothetical protein